MTSEEDHSGVYRKRKNRDEQSEDSQPGLCINNDFPVAKCPRIDTDHEKQQDSEKKLRKLDMMMNLITQKKRKANDESESDNRTEKHQRIDPDDPDSDDDEPQFDIAGALGGTAKDPLPSDFIEDWQLSDQQLFFINAVLSGENVFCTGAAGTGKSFTLLALFQRLDRLNKKYVATATTGTAACQVGAITLHSFMKLGICEDPIPIIKKKIKSDPELQAVWTSVRILCIDEVSMLQPRMIDIIDQAAKVARECYDKAFGGMQVVFTGDFCQLPPVIKDEDRELSRNWTAKFGQFACESANSKYEFAFEHPIWKESVKRTIELTKVFRQTDPDFVGMLHRIRLGEAKPSDHAEIIGIVRSTGKFPSVEQMKDENGIKPTEICATNKQVDETNDRELNKLEPNLAKRFTFMAETRIINGCPENEKYFESWIHQMKNDSPVKNKIAFAIGSQVMLVKNLDVAGGLTNGSRGVIVGMSEPMTGGVENEDATLDMRPYPIVKFLNGKQIIIQRHTWTRKHVSTLGSAAYSQVPLKLADAMTSNKSQGATLDRVLLRLGSMVHWGQAYTALSRVRTKAGLFIANYSKACVKIHPKVKAFYLALSHASRTY